MKPLLFALAACGLSVVYADQAMAAPLPSPCLELMRAAMKADLAKVVSAETAARLAAGFNADEQTAAQSQTVMNAELAAGRLEPAHVIAGMTAAYLVATAAPNVCPAEAVRLERADFDKASPMILAMLAMQKAKP